VRAAVASARARAAAEEGPTMIEAMTYRHMGHSRSDPAAYRPDGELERWMQHDPIATFAAALPDHDAISEDDVEAVRHAAAEAVAGALERALSWPEPEPGQRFDHVWAAPA
jgi:acetoin:2,6-dichlorophenolindophenol oxidoreductase subunit alpha